MASFLIVTTPITGHVSPLLPVARSLVGRGHELRWYTSARFKDRIEATGAQLVPFRTARDVDYHKLDDLFPERAKLKGLAQGKWDLRLMIDMGREQLEDLSLLLREFPADVVLGDTFALSAHLLAEETARPCALLNVTNLFLPSRDTAPDGLALRPSSTPLGRIRNKILNWLVLRVFIRDINAYWNECRKEVGLAPTSASFLELPVHHTDLFLQPTVAAFEYPRSDLPRHVHFIGALLPDEPDRFERPSWWRELDGSRSTVLVTQGTVATSPEALLLPAIRGLASENVLVVATTGNRACERMEVESLPANVRLEPFVPFGHLMRHVDVMVTNGGYGGTHYALTHGVPLVAAGQSEDKAEICARIGWAGVGVALRTAKPTADQIRRAVRTVLDDPRYKQRAQAMQAEFARLDSVVRATELLEGLVPDRSQES